MAQSILTKSNQKINLQGVNVAGYLTAELGIGAAARGYVKALKQANFEVALNNFDVVTSRTEDHTFTTFASNNPYPVNLICVNANQVNTFVERQGADYFKGKYNIGVWWWETPEFPDEWKACFDYFDEIWVGSSYIQNAISRVSPIPVVLVPPCLSVEPALADREKFGFAPDEFVFLCLFDFFSVFERKNPLGTIEAFKAAFTQGEPVRLVLKCINGDHYPAEMTRLKESIAGSKISILDEYLSGQENQSLIASCDAFVSLHRAEGLGLPIAEAMLQKRPVIATAWSGNMDFTTLSNSYLVSYKLALNGSACAPYKVADIWAEPDIDHAVLQMRSVYLDRQQAGKIGAQAKADVETYFLPETIAHIMQSRLNAVSAFSRIDSAGLPTDCTDYSGSGAQQMVASERGGAAGKVTDFLYGNKLVRPIYSALMRRLFGDATKLQGKVDLIDSRTRKQLANADRRIAELEQAVEKLKAESPKSKF